ncbi:MAG: TVP38/TMEM64 family protein [Corynebacterium sp.]|nr:TVP38/TMEM64 family protein [Corynebacterium sp.]
MIRDFCRGVFRDAWGAILAWPLWKKLTIGCALIAVAIVVTTTDINLAMLRSWSDQAGSWFPLVFFVLYVAITQFPIPRTVLTLSSGVLFGPLNGIVLALAATTLSAAVSLLVVRKMLGEWMRPRLQHPAVAGIDARLRQRGWLAVFSLRMIGPVPFSILNYVAALTSVRLVPFLIATALGSTPGTIVAVVFGDALTGHLDPTVLLVMLASALVGVAGLTLDARIPVQNINHTR